MLDLVIIGAGPAGLTAAIYAVRAQLDAVVLEKGPGQIASTGAVDNYPGLPGVQGLVLSESLRKHALQLGAVLREGKAVQIEDRGTHKEVFLANGEHLEAKTVIAASGASPRPLGVPGEDAFRGRGVSYCAMCDGAFYYGKRVCVVGGGDTAVEDALSLARQAKEVFLIHRRDRLRAQKGRASRLLELENVSVRWNTVVDEILGDSSGVTGIRLRSTDGDHEELLPVDGVFIAVGMQPETGYLQGLAGADGYVQAGEDCRTAIPGLFAAGDLRQKHVRQVITAAADGAAAVRSVQEYLEA